jgi:hypothetical protein
LARFPKQKQKHILVLSSVRVDDATLAKLIVLVAGVATEVDVAAISSSRDRNDGCGARSANDEGIKGDL